MPGLALPSSLQAGDSLHHLARTVLAKMLQKDEGPTVLAGPSSLEACGALWSARTFLSYAY